MEYIGEEGRQWAFAPNWSAKVRVQVRVAYFNAAKDVQEQIRRFERCQESMAGLPSARALPLSALTLVPNFGFITPAEKMVLQGS
jgi:hypothetical protein